MRVDLVSSFSVPDVASVALAGEELAFCQEGSLWTVRRSGPHHRVDGISDVDEVFPVGSERFLAISIGSQRFVLVADGSVGIDLDFGAAYVYGVDTLLCSDTTLVGCVTELEFVLFLLGENGSLYRLKGLSGQYEECRICSVSSDQVLIGLYRQGDWLWFAIGYDGETRQLLLPASIDPVLLQDDGEIFGLDADGDGIRHVASSGMVRLVSWNEWGFADAAIGYGARQVFEGFVCIDPYGGLLFVASQKGTVEEQVVRVSSASFVFVALERSTAQQLALRDAEGRVHDGRVLRDG